MSKENIKDLIKKIETDKAKNVLSNTNRDNNIMENEKINEKIDLKKTKTIRKDPVLSMKIIDYLEKYLLTRYINTPIEYRAEGFKVIEAMKNDTIREDINDELTRIIRERMRKNKEHEKDFMIIDNKKIEQMKEYEKRMKQQINYILLQLRNIDINDIEENRLINIIKDMLKIDKKDYNNEKLTNIIKEVLRNYKKNDKEDKKNEKKEEKKNEKKEGGVKKYEKLMKRDIRDMGEYVKDMRKYDKDIKEYEKNKRDNKKNIENNKEIIKEDENTMRKDEKKMRKDEKEIKKDQKKMRKKMKQNDKKKKKGGRANNQFFEFLDLYFNENPNIVRNRQAIKKASDIYNKYIK
jgi:hypothetical protein